MQDHSRAAAVINAAIRAVDEARVSYRNEIRAIRHSAVYGERRSAQRQLVELSVVLRPDADENF